MDRAEEYRRQVQKSICFIRQDVSYFTEVKARRLLSLVGAFLGDTTPLRALDVGCGVGLTDQFLTGSFGELHGVDVDESALTSAAETNPNAHYRLYDGRALPYSDCAFDLVFAINVLHHVPPSSWQCFAQEMRRVNKIDGITVVFEHNPINPLTRLAVSRCEFDGDATLVGRRRLGQLLTQAGLTVVDSSYILFSPFRSGLMSKLESRLGWLPLGAQHYAAGRKDGE
ncbi:MAG: class I SAM-dependent methyltransferase [Armatimonadota bacterium]|nr:class I SAM-dependent methyltransferase [Armatimonadota bacterium]